MSSTLVSYYDDEPVDLKGKVEIQQAPMPQGVDVRLSDGALRPGLVYVLVPSPVGPPLHVPFASYDEWSLRDRYNEALRIVNTLGASHVDCQSFREAKKGSRLKIGVKKFGASAGSQKVHNSGFDYSHMGTGSPARDPRPLQWPHEPGFAAAVEGVLDNKATQVTINISSSQTYSANGSTGKALRKLGFELGVSAERSEVSNLHITAQFPASKKSWL